jgi:hypothetical protein
LPKGDDFLTHRATRRRLPVTTALKTFDPIFLHQAGRVAKGAALKATEQPIDTGTAAGKCFLDMLGVFAEFETNLRRERQLEGIAKAKAAGVYKGRKPSIDPNEVRRLKAEGLGASEIAKALKIGRASVTGCCNSAHDHTDWQPLRARGRRSYERIDAEEVRFLRSS